VPEQDLMPIPQTGYVAVLSKNAEASDSLAAHLRERGFEVKVYHTDQEPDRLLRLPKVPPAAVVLDQDTATQYGWALLERLKHQAAAEQIPVLVYSLDLERDRGEWLELNYLPKPLASEDLVDQLGRYVDSDERLVLVVDDDPGILDLHCRLVKQAGCRAVCARNGRLALEMLEYTRPDLILLDLMMPELDGFAVIEALRAREATRDIPVIILTARVLDETDIERLNRGVATIMSKELFSTAETLTRIESALAKHQALGHPTQRLIRQAMAYIHQHYAEPLTREEIASYVHFSPDYLTDCFRQEQGITPMVYLNRYRIFQARSLLEDSDLTITQVALAVGFSEGAHFTRTFRREVGMTPRAYRRSNRA
jgi:DNA-binding response OmpR family regulator